MGPPKGLSCTRGSVDDARGPVLPHPSTRSFLRTHVLVLPEAGAPDPSTVTGARGKDGAQLLPDLQGSLGPSLAQWTVGPGLPAPATAGRWQCTPAVPGARQVEASGVWARLQGPSSGPPRVLPVVCGAATGSPSRVRMLPPDSQGVCIYISFTLIFRVPCPLPGPEVCLSAHPSTFMPSPCPLRTAHLGGENCPAPFSGCPPSAQAQRPPSQTNG